MRKLWGIAVLATIVAAAAPALAADDNKANASDQAVEKAFESAFKAAKHGPANVTLGDQATLALPKGMIFVPPAEGKALMEQMGNQESEHFLGLVMGEDHPGRWIIDATWEDAGYIKDDDAKSWNADDLLKTLKEGTEEGNKERHERGITEFDVVDWVEKPNYDAANRRLVWAASTQEKGAPKPEGINYNTYALGREGYISMNLLCGLDKIDQYRPMAKSVLANLTYKNGKRYQDFQAGTDKVAEYGLAALVAGVAAHKLGLFALIAAFAIKSVKVLVVAAIAGVAAVRKFLTGKKAT